MCVLNIARTAVFITLAITSLFSPSVSPLLPRLANSHWSWLPVSLLKGSSPVIPGRVPFTHLLFGKILLRGPSLHSCSVEVTAIYLHASNQSMFSNLTFVFITASYTTSATSIALRLGYRDSTSLPTTWILSPLSWTILLFTISDLNTPLSILPEQSALLLLTISMSSKSVFFRFLVFSLVLWFFTFLISSLILIIPSALPILLILSVVFFPSFWNSGATLLVSSPLETMIAVIISVQSISTSSVISLSSSPFMASSPSRISSPSSTNISSSFSFIQLQIAFFMTIVFSGQFLDNFIFSNTILNSVSCHLFIKIVSISSMLHSSVFQPSGRIASSGPASSSLSHRTLARVFICWRGAPTPAWWQGPPLLTS